MSFLQHFRSRKRIPFARWGCRVCDLQLPTDGFVQYAYWLHPNITPHVFHQDEVDGLRTFLRPGQFAIDIGAQGGDTTVPMALAAGPTGCVLALEPNPNVFEVLEVNAALNRAKTNIQPRCFAATETDGQFVFHYCDASFCNGGFRSQQRWKFFRRKHPLTIAGRNLLAVLRDDFAEWLPKLAYVKVDAEGYDRAILESIMPVLRETRPVIRTEVYRKLMNGERRALFDLLVDNGYEPYRFQGGSAPQGQRMTRQTMTDEKHFDLLAIPTPQRAQKAA